MSISKNTKLLHPDTGSEVFGNIARMTSRGEVFEPGAIHLLLGFHKGPNLGWGAAHIWHEHQQEMSRIGLKLFEDVPMFVSQIVQTGTPLYYEGGRMRNQRVLAVRNASGTAVLEYRQHDVPFWSVVTAFAGNRTHGTRLGAVR